jgi:N-acetylglucosamine-6-phosphate deacetylase
VTTPDRPTHLRAHRLFDGKGGAPLSDQIVQLDSGLIRDVWPASARDAHEIDLREYDIIAPGFIDLQINGAADAQFNFTPTPETLAAMAKGAQAGGTAHILPTFMTARDRDYLHAIEAVRAAMAADSPGILGLHLEGPFLSTERPGIHPPNAIRSLSPEDITCLEAANLDGPLLLTVAPECLPDGALDRLVHAGLIAFAGHSAATADQIARAEAKGLRGATHLFNAMSQITGREPGVVGAVIASARLFAGIIADGHHVDWRNIALAARAMPDRLFLVTDAMLTLAGTQAGFGLNGRAITLADGRLTDASGRLAGAHIDMISCIRNVVAHCDVSLASALRMASGVPAKAIGVEAHLGAIGPGYRASLTCMTDALEVQSVVVDGSIQVSRSSSPKNEWTISGCRTAALK